MEFENHLKAWGLQDFFQAFRDESISDESFDLINEDTINKIFSKAGPELIFQKHYTAYKRSLDKIPLDATNITVIPLEEPLLIDLNKEISFSETDIDSLSSRCLMETPSTSSFLDVSDSNNENVLSEDICRPKRLNTYKSIFCGGIEAALKKSIDGQIVLANKNHLNNDHWQKLVKALINEMMAVFGPELRASTFMQVSEEIEDFFINEEAAAYYIPYIPGGKNKKGINPRGKLWSRFCNVKKALRGANSCMVRAEVNYKSPEKTVALLESHNFIKLAVEPLEKVKEAWINTYRIRQKEFLGVDLMIELDFETKFPKHKKVLYETWPKISPALFKEYEEKKIDLRDFQFKEPALQQITLLPYLFRTVNVKSSRKGLHWRPSRSEVLESFFLIIYNFDELEQHIKQRQEKLKRYGTTLQPLAIVVCGAGKEDFYIVVEDIRYKVDTALRTLELLFKLFNSMDIDYPAESEHIWIFIHQILFNLKSEKKNPSSEAAIADIKYYLQL